MKTFIIKMVLCLIWLSGTVLAVNPPRLLMLTNYDGDGGFNLIRNEAGEPLEAGSLLHLILDADGDGADNPIREGENRGSPSGDDVLILQTRMESFGGVDESGAFLIALTSLEGDEAALSVGDRIFVRAFNTPEITDESRFCESAETYPTPEFPQVLIDNLSFPERMEGRLSIERRQTLLIPENWSMISINVSPGPAMYREDEARGPDVIQMLEQFRGEEDHNVVIFKDESGFFYNPMYGFCNIPYWDLTRGYQIKVNQAAEAVWSGEPIPPDADIPLGNGWNMIAYFPDYELPSEANDFYVLSPILDHVLIAKDENGQFMIPEWGFSNMGNWRQGKGYQVKTDAEVVLNYPEPQGMLAVVDEVATEQPAPWRPPRPTGVNLSLLVNSISGLGKVKDGWVAAFDYAGNVVGLGRIGADGRCGLAVWGDDPTTPEKDGLGEGEAFRLEVNRMDRIGRIVIQNVLTGEGLIYCTDAFTVMRLNAEAVPAEFGIISAYPNPFNSRTSLRFGLDAASEVEVGLYDVSGRLIQRVLSGHLTAGEHSAVIDGSALSSGVYIISLKAGDRISRVKVTLLR